MPVLSIIVPIYKVENYLPKCIDSLISQTLKDIEIILVNDGSPDQCGQICDEYSIKDKRIKVIHKENGGLSDARNAGIIIAKGNYIGFVDSDDWIEKDMFERLYDTAIKTNADITIIGLREVDERGKVLTEFVPKDKNFSEILKRAYAWNKIYKKELFISNDLYFASGRYYEDIELIPKLYTKSKKVSVVQYIGYNYLKRGGSATGARDEKILDNLWAYTRLKDYLIKEEIYEKYQSSFEEGVRYFKRYLANIMYDYPTLFLLKNTRRIYNDLDKLGGLSIKEIISFSVRHNNIVLKRLGFKFIKKPILIIKSVK